MKYNLQILGSEQRHITSFEKNKINKLNSIVNLNEATIYYDKTLFEVDEQIYVLFNIKYGKHKTLTSTTSGDTVYEALQKAIHLTADKLNQSREVIDIRVTTTSNNPVLAQAG